MVTAKESQAKIDLMNPQYYFNRELSWLKFNDRVLYEAFDTRNPLIEQLKFAAIFSSNLDEFFMVRVSGLLEQVQAEVEQRTSDGLTPKEQVEAIHQYLRPVVTKQHQHFQQKLRPQLAAQGIHLLDYGDLSAKQQAYLKSFFEQRVFPILTPLSVDSAHPFPRMSNLSLNLVVVVQDPITLEERLARIKVPNTLPRFIALPEALQEYQGKPCAWVGVPLEQLIAHHLDALFPGMLIQTYDLFRITRDADFPVREDEADDLLLAIQQEISKRRLEGFVVRLELQHSISEHLKAALIQGLGVTATEVYEVEGLLNLQDLMFFLSLPFSELKDPPWTPLIPPRLQRTFELDNYGSTSGEDIFSVLRQGDLLVHHPYDSFKASVQEFITQAAYDPGVKAIKITLYRTSGDSPIIKALIAAAGNGKQVVALVELKARFDEENNIIWAQTLENAGVHVVYGVVGLKTHTKILLIVREEEEQIRRYFHIGTGNYNPKTANLYTDLGLLSCQPEIGADLTDLFNFLTGYSRQKTYRKLLVAPMTLRDRMVALVQREVEHCKQGHSSHLILKMNSLTDSQMVRVLYEASQAGVQIDLILRGICCLRPGIKGVSDHIRVISVIGRYLEHSRIFYFHNNGQPEVFIGSADWMSRNLDRRVEAVTPIEDPLLVQQLKDILDIMLADNRQAWDLNSDGTYVQRRPSEHETPRGTHALLMAKARGE